MKKIIIKEKNSDNDFVGILVQDLKNKFIIKLVDMEVTMHFPKETYEYILLEDK